MSGTRLWLVVRVVLALLICGGWWLLLFPGCSLLRLNRGENPDGDAPALVSRLEVVVPEIGVNLGWTGGSWLTKDQTFLAGMVICGVLVVLGFVASRLRRP